MVLAEVNRNNSVRTTKIITLEGPGVGRGVGSMALSEDSDLEIPVFPFPTEFRDAIRGFTIIQNPFIVLIQLSGGGEALFLFKNV